MSSGFPPLFNAASFAERPIVVKKISSKSVLEARTEDDIEVEEHLEKQHGYSDHHGSNHGIGHVDAPEEGNRLADVAAHKQRNDPNR